MLKSKQNHIAKGDTHNIIPNDRTEHTVTWMEKFNGCLILVMIMYGYYQISRLGEDILGFCNTTMYSV